jgi:hypothetical protein
VGAAADEVGAAAADAVDAAEVEPDEVELLPHAASNAAPIAKVATSERAIVGLVIVFLLDTRS